MSDRMSSRWPRVSLLNLLLLTAVVALGATVAMVWRADGPLREENLRLAIKLTELRSALTELQITHKDRLHAVCLGHGDDGLSRWRLYLPPDRAFRVWLADEARMSGKPVPGDVSLDVSADAFGPYVDVHLLVDTADSTDDASPGVAKLSIVPPGDQTSSVSMPLSDEGVEHAIAAGVGGVSYALDDSYDNGESPTKAATWSFATDEPALLTGHCLFVSEDAWEAGFATAVWRERVRPGLMLWIEPLADRAAGR